IQPIWIRVNVPAAAVAGRYRGKLTVSVAGRGKGIVVPVDLRVADWKLPDPRKFRTHAGIYQSPATLAMRYKVKPWSERHWQLVDKSFALLARAGNDLINIPVVDRTQFGNDEGMVYWVRKPSASGSR
ncbi:hypothetical protein LCGC14_2553450, partial [marine sediment metagenome]